MTAILPGDARNPPGNRLYDVYQEGSAAVAGSSGGTGPRRPSGTLLVCDTDEEARHWWSRGAAFCGAAWFAPFGFGQGIEAPGEKREDLTLDKMLERGHLLVGTVDSVTRQLETMMKQAPVHHLMAYQYNGFIPHEMQLKSLELFATKVWPRFKDIETMA